MLFYYVYTANI